MRIALFTDTYVPDVNGVARTLKRWIDYLKRQDIECMVFAPDSPEDPREYRSLNSVERFASMPFLLYPECRLAIPNPIHIRRALQQFKPNLIHVATPFNLGLCGIHYSRKHDIPLIASYHTNFDQYLPFYNLQWMAKLLWTYLEWFHRDCGTIFVPSKSTYGDLIKRGWNAQRMEIWSRGIDTAAYHPKVNREDLFTRHDIGNDKFIVLYVGRLAPEKNVETAIEAFASFQRRVCPESVMVLAGDGPSMEMLRKKCLDEQVDARFIGFTTMPELQRWYAAADVFLFPSPTETFGNVVLEAMACGTPVICANKGGVVDTVEHGVTGLRCSPHHTQEFADALELLYRNENLRRSMAANGRAYSLKQSWDTIFENLLKCCEQQISSSDTPIRHIID
ncbi:glycosyltransferase family 4 protein [Paenibacillus prosopidis]|uniref:Glycosyltransferase involved in cell wall biosynthesis n=1 Tax=Paenibacillus prosopidis TaxID=630520 RepID=A0A368VKU3_9BACL|nr:glycosyltransferase family 1 protein [Paenibacillus prosopidis]RCW42158.1 glycosyltransferase involved in cell wall biosynthesis [Paenibacillus prosopidis]